MTSISTTQSPQRNLLQRVQETRARASEIEDTLDDHPYAEDQILLKVDADLSQEQIRQLAADYGATVGQQFPIPEVMKEKFNGQLLLLKTGASLSEAQTMAAMEGDSRVLLSAVNDQMELVNGVTAPRVNANGEPVTAEAGQDERLPNDLNPEQWALRNKNIRGGKDGADISAGKAWNITTGGGKNGPIIAVIDSGIDAFHEDIKDNMWVNPVESEKDGQDNDRDGFTDDVHGLNAVDGTGNIFDEVGHGTHVAGIIGAVGNNEKGIAGVNWDTQLMGVKIAEGERVSLIAAINGTLYATERGARIANHSWGGPRRNPILEDVMASSPMLHVCAAGNAQQDSDQHPFYPAGFDSPNIISVGASTRRDDPLFFSNWGANTVDVHAPGARVFSTLPVHEYDELSGTSMASPHVAGVAGLIVSKFPDITNEEIRDRIMFSSDPLEGMRQLSVSGGRLNAFRALEDDKIAPADITGLKVTGTSADGFSISWNGVGDDGMEGKAARYELLADFGDKQQRLIPQFPKGSGEKEVFNFQTNPLDVERPFSLKLNAVDNVGNRSGVATTSGVMPAAEVPLSNNFDADDNWTTEGTWGKVAVEGRGLVYSDSPEGPHEPGSDTSLTSPAFSLKDMRNATLSFDAKMTTNKYDFLFVEVSTDGKGWKNLEVLRQDRTPGYDQWGSYKMDLSKYDGQEHVQIRFNYEPSNKSKEDGVMVDNVKVISAKNVGGEA